MKNKQPRYNIPTNLGQHPFDRTVDRSIAGQVVHKLGFLKNQSEAFIELDNGHTIQIESRSANGRAVLSMTIRDASNKQLAWKIASE